VLNTDPEMALQHHGWVEDDYGSHFCIACQQVSEILEEETATPEEMGVFGDKLVEVSNKTIRLAKKKVKWYMDEDILYRLRKRAEIRRQITTRKSVQEGKPDRIAELLEEAADEIERMRIEQIKRMRALALWNSTLTISVPHMAMTGLWLDLLPKPRSF
jgi:hypothetical protein